MTTMIFCYIYVWQKFDSCYKAITVHATHDAIYVLHKQIYMLHG